MKVCDIFAFDAMTVGPGQLTNLNHKIHFSHFVMIFLGYKKY